MFWSVAQSIRNLLFGVPTNSEGNSSPDLIASVLVHIVALVPRINIHMDDVASVSRQLSLLLVGFIILSSVRLILERVGRVLKVSSRTLSAAFLLLLLAQLMVCPLFFLVRVQFIIPISTGIVRPIHNRADPYILSTRGVVIRKQPLCDSPSVPDVWCTV